MTVAHNVQMQNLNMLIQLPFIQLELSQRHLYSSQISKTHYPRCTYKK